MKRQQVLLVSLAVLLAVSATTTLTLAQGPKGTGPALAPLASAGTAFTYQGQLKNAAGSVNGSCNFQFGLWDALTLGTQVGVTQTKSSVSVTGGLFTTPIDFGAYRFNGDARWLAIQVACPAGGTYAPLTPRQELTAAPYAVGLLPGATIAGPAGTALSAVSTALQGTGIIGEANNGANAWGVYGYSSSGIGVWAGSDNNVTTPHTALSINGGKLAVGGAVQPAFIFTVIVVSSGCSSMSSPLFDGDPNAMIFVTPRQTTTLVPATDVRVLYNAPTWSLCSPSLAPSMTYNVLVINQ